jgi:NAD(P)-dependent dehydrogenase (short-subunit alcohol dehydrogenase family)
MTIFDRLRIDDHVAVVTRGGQGIGRAIAVGLASCGCDVVINARRLGDLEQTAADIESFGRRALIVGGDVRGLSEKIADRTIEAFGRLDVWVNNVGGSDDKTTMPLIDTPVEVFRSQLELNLTTAFQGCKAAAKRMRHGGSIINISSGRRLQARAPHRAARGCQGRDEQSHPDVGVGARAPHPGECRGSRPRCYRGVHGDPERQRSTRSNWQPPFRSDGLELPMTSPMRRSSWLPMRRAG